MAGKVHRHEVRFELRVEEVRDRVPLGAGKRAHDLMDGRLEVTAADQLEHLSDVHHERAGHGRHVDESAVSLDLETAHVVLVDEGEKSGVSMGTDALARGDVSEVS